MRKVRYVAPQGSPSQQAITKLRGNDPLGLVTMDALDGSLAQMGRNGNANEDVNIWHKVMVTPFISYAGGGGTVLIVDHAPLNGGRVIGAQSKKARLTGVSYQLRVVKRMIPGQIGVLDLLTDKDKCGGVRAISGPVQRDGTQHTARITLDATDPENIRTAIDPPPTTVDPTASGEATTDLDLDTVKQRISEAVESADKPPSQNDLVDVTGMDRADAIKVVKGMVTDGYLRTSPGARNSIRHTSLRPFRASSGSSVVP